MTKIARELQPVISRLDRLFFDNHLQIQNTPEYRARFTAVYEALEALETAVRK